MFLEFVDGDEVPVGDGQAVVVGRHGVDPEGVHPGGRQPHIEQFQVSRGVPKQQPRDCVYHPVLFRAQDIDPDPV